MSRDLSQATVHPEKVKPSSAVSRWSMDDADVSSGTIQDTWGSNDGTLNGGVTTGASGVGYTGEAFSFDGSDDDVVIGSVFRTNSPYTISVWFNKDSTTSTKEIVSISNTIKLSYEVHGSNGYEANVYDGSSWNTVSTGEHITNQWVHAVLVYDGSSASVYLNGSQSVSEPVNTARDVTYDTIIADNGNDRNFDGKIDEVRIYSEALSQQQVWQLYNIGTHAPWRMSHV